MKRLQFASVACLGLAFALVLSACGPSNPVTGNADFAVATFDLAGADLTGSCASASSYPPGPYGNDVGFVIANLMLQGKHDSNGNGSITDETARPMCLSDYYQDKSLHALAILFSAEWCAPCQAEQPDLIKAYNDYAAAHKGVAFLEIIVQNRDNTTGDLDTLDRWATKFQVPFDMAADQNGVFKPYYNVMAFPGQLVVSTADMTIQALHNGDMPGWVKQQVDALVP